MKRMLAVIITMMLCLGCAQAEIGDTVKAIEDGLSNIRFDNGYLGYCIDYGDAEATKGNAFIEQSADSIENNKDHEKVGNFLKVFFVEFYDIAKEDEVKTQYMIWHFTDDFNGWRIDPEKIEKIEAAEKTKTIPDHGATKKLADGTELIFDFIRLQAKTPRHADFFGYKITKVVTVKEYESTQMKADVQDGVSYLWQIERGNGWEDMSSQTKETLTYSRAARAQDGFRFRCKMTDANGGITYSNEFLLKVIPYVAEDEGGVGDRIPQPESNTPPAGNTPPPDAEELPKTGDPAPLALCAALLMISAAAYLYLRKKQTN